MEHKQLHLETPLLLSKPLSDLIERDVYLKLENVQPCNSFKIRGTSCLCQTRAEEGFKSFVTFSGGNAGITLAYVGYTLGMPAHIVVPPFVSNRVLNKMRTYGAEVTIAPSSREAENQAMAIAQNDSTVAFIHPYDDPKLWSGVSEIVKEIKGQLQGVVPSCFVCSVGGAGLLCGILEGLERQDWSDVPVIAMETDGAHSLNKSIKEGKLVENVLTSIAKTLGAPAVTPRILEIIPRFNVISEVLSDKEAVKACYRFTDDHAFLVEPACGVTLATVYSKLLPDLLTKRGVVDNKGPIVLIVCGGCDTNVEILQGYAKHVGLTEEEISSLMK